MTETEQNEKLTQYEIKEMLYSLFYELKSEILSKKIEINEEDYQENVRSITIKQLVDYIHDSIQILMDKKISDAKLEQYNEDLDNQSMKSKGGFMGDCENIMKKLENKERVLIKHEFQFKLQKEAMENKIADYMDMEDEFEEMKAKFKYEDGRFLTNDRKDHEIVIIRKENNNLKNVIKELENKISKYEKNKLEYNSNIKELNQEIGMLKNKLEEKQRELSFFNNININISNNNGNSQSNCGNNIGHNGNNSSNLTKYSLNNNDIYYSHNNTLKDELNYTNGTDNSTGNKILHFHKIKRKISQKQKENRDKREIREYKEYIKSNTNSNQRVNISNHNISSNTNYQTNYNTNHTLLNQREILSGQKKESLEKLKNEMIKKYLNNNNNNNNLHLNSTNSFIKIMHMPITNLKSNYNNYNIPLLNAKANNISNLINMKKLFSYGNYQNPGRTASTLRQGHTMHNSINYRRDKSS